MKSENLEREEENTYPGRHRRWSGGDGGTTSSSVVRSSLHRRRWSGGDGGVGIALVVFVAGGDGGRVSSSPVEMEELESDVFGDELDLHRWRAACILGFFFVV
ncbi:hypothetical protein Dimus_016313 [Dionaea muscipula]